VQTYVPVSAACYSCQAAAYASSDGILTEAMVDEIVAEAMRAHRKKFDWRAEQEDRVAPSTSPLPRSAKDFAAFTPPAAQSQATAS